MSAERGRRFEELLVACAPASALVDQLEDVPPGPALYSRLVALRGRLMDGSDSIRLAAHWERYKAHVEAESMIPIADALAFRDAAPHSDYLSGIGDIADELAPATGLSTTTATNRVALVEQVNLKLPQGWEALHRGDWTLSHLTCMAGALRHVDAEISMAVERVIVPAACAQSWTPYQVKQETAKALIAIDPDGAADRAKKARSNDDVQFFGGHDETATIQATGAALQMRMSMDLVERLARQFQADGDTRPINQLRIAAFHMLIPWSGHEHRRSPATGRAEVVVSMDLATCFGFSNGVAEVSGYGPISAETARELLADASFRRMITDPMTGDLIDLGATAYRPSAALSRFIKTRDGKCTFPGCSRLARSCDCDHIVNFDPGRTDRSNLHLLCRRHHNRKTHGGWAVVRHEDGTETWTSPFGLQHTRGRPRYDVERVYPPDDGHLPDDLDDRVLDSDPDPPRPDEPLPDSPEMTLEEYFIPGDDLDRALIVSAITHRDTFYRSDDAA